MSDDLARHVLGRLPRRLLSRTAADDRGSAESGEVNRVVAIIAGRLGVDPRVIEGSLAGRRPRDDINRSG